MSDEKMITVCDCGHTVESNGFSTGYGINDKGEKICFACCGKKDEKYLREHGVLSGYFSGKDGKYEFSNWPGTFRLPVLSYRKSYHNFVGKDGRIDFWVVFEGNTYHGVNINHASNECATIRKTKKN